MHGLRCTYCYLCICLSPAHADRLSGQGRNWGSRRPTVPWALSEGHPSSRPPEEAGRSCEGGRGPGLAPPRGGAPEACLLRGHCWTVYGDQGMSVPSGAATSHSILVGGVGSRRCPAAHGQSKDFQRPPHPTLLETGSLTGPVRGSRPPGCVGQGRGRTWQGHREGGFGHSAHTPAVLGEAGSPCPCPP